MDEICSLSAAMRMEVHGIKESLVGVKVQMDEAVDTLKALLSRLPNPPGKSFMVIPSSTNSASSLGEDQSMKSDMGSAVFESENEVIAEEVDEFDLVPQWVPEECSMLTLEEDDSVAHKVFDEMPMSQNVDYIKVCPLPIELQFIAPPVDGLGVINWPTGVGTLLTDVHGNLFAGRSFIPNPYHDMMGFGLVASVVVPREQLCISSKNFSNFVATQRTVEEVLDSDTYGVSGRIKEGIDTANSYGNWRHLNLKCITLHKFGREAQLGLVDGGSLMYYFIKPDMISLSWTVNEDDPHYKRAQKAVFVLAKTVDANKWKLEIIDLHGPRLLYMTVEEVASVVHYAFLDSQLITDFGMDNHILGCCFHIDNAFHCHLRKRPIDGFLKWKWQPGICKKVYQYFNRVTAVEVSTYTTPLSPKFYFEVGIIRQTDPLWKSLVHLPYLVQLHILHTPIDGSADQRQFVIGTVFKEKDSCIHRLLCEFPVLIVAREITQHYSTWQEVSTVAITVVFSCSPILKSLQSLGIDTDRTISEEETIYAVIYAFKSLINACISRGLIKQEVDQIMAGTNTNASMSAPTIIESICATIESLLDHPLTNVVFLVVFIAFDKLDANSPSLLSRTCTSLTEVQKLAIESLPYSNLLYECLGYVLCAMGSVTFLYLLSSKLEAKDLSEENVWLFLILTQYTVGARLKFSTSEILSMLEWIIQNSDQEMKSSAGSCYSQVLVAHGDRLPSLKNVASIALKLSAREVNWSFYNNLDGVSGSKSKWQLKSNYAINMESITSVVDILSMHLRDHIAWITQGCQGFKFSLPLLFMIMMQSLPRQQINNGLLRTFEVCFLVLKSEWNATKSGEFHVEEFQAHMLDWDCKRFVTQLVDLDVTASPTNFLLHLFWRLLEAFNDSTPTYLLRDDDEYLLREVFVFFASSKLKNVSNGHFHHRVSGTRVGLYDRIGNYTTAFYLAVEKVNTMDKVEARSSLIFSQFMNDLPMSIQSRVKVITEFCLASNFSITVKCFLVVLAQNEKGSHVIDNKEFLKILRYYASDCISGIQILMIFTCAFNDATFIDRVCSTVITRERSMESIIDGSLALEVFVDMRDQYDWVIVLVACSSPKCQLASCVIGVRLHVPVSSLDVQCVLKMKNKRCYVGRIWEAGSEFVVPTVFASAELSSTFYVLNQILEDKNHLKERVMIRIIYARELLELVEFHIVWAMMLFGLLYILWAFVLVSPNHIPIALST